VSEESDVGSARDEFERLKPAGDEAADLGRATRHAEQIEEGAVELRPRGVGEVLDLGLDLVRSRFGTCVALGALVWMPIQLITTLLPRPEAVTPGDISELWVQLIRYSLWINVAVVIGDLLVVACVARIIGDAIEGRHAGAGRALRTAVTRLPGLIVLAVLTYSSVIVGLCLVLVPGLIVAWVMAPAPYVYVIEGVGLRTAIRRSIRLSTGQLVSMTSFFAFWRLAGILVVGAVLVLPFSFIVWTSDFPSVRAWAIEALHLSVPAYNALRVVFGGLFLGAATTVRAGYLTVFYLDCRVRREGLDLETWLGRIRPKEKGSVPA